MNNNKNTIFALATPSGKSAFAVFRISGPKAYKNISSISSKMPITEKIASLNNIKDVEGNNIDQTITTFFKAPNSYSGEDTVEISVHGSNAVIDKIVSTLINLPDMRLAEPGEFTRRAFENNKLDLTQVEAIADLINSETETQRKQAYHQLKGELSKKTNYFTKRIMNVLANVEAAIDFSDEELPKNIEVENLEQTKNIITDIKGFIKNSDVGEKIRNGFIVSIVGKTNTGKSSFINNIAKREIAIVTDEPGTTRDMLEVFIDFKGLPIRFFDTAGLRKSSNTAEKIGIKKAYNLSKISDINLIFIDDEFDIPKYDKFNNKIFIKSKSDIKNESVINKQILNISSKTGQGIDKIFKKIYKKLNKLNLGENTSVSRERHKNNLVKTINYLQKSLEKKNYDLVAEDIRLALREISKITGKVDIENILEIIFNDFCIGK